MNLIQVGTVLWPEEGRQMIQNMDPTLHFELRRCKVCATTTEVRTPGSRST